MGPHLATNWLGLGLDFEGVLPQLMSCQGHLKVKQAKMLNKKTFLTVFCCKDVFHKVAADILWFGSLPTCILWGTVNIMWLGGVIPHSYISRPVLYHTLYQHYNQCKKWSIGVLWNMGLKSQSTWGTHTWVPQGCSWHIVAGKPSNTHPRGYSDFMWLGGVIP